MKEKNLWNLYAWKLRDIILASLLAALFAVVCFATFHGVNFGLMPLLAPLGLGIFPLEAVFGVFFFSALFAGYVMQKPGVATVVGFLTGLIQVFMGSAGAATVAVSGLVQGFGAEVIFALFRYKKFNWTTMILAAIGATVASFILAWYRDLFVEIQFSIIAGRFVVRSMSAILISGIIAKALADRLAYAGVLKSYPLGANYVGEIDEPASE